MDNTQSNKKALPEKMLVGGLIRTSIGHQMVLFEIKNGRAKLVKQTESDFLNITFAKLENELLCTLDPTNEYYSE